MGSLLDHLPVRDTHQNEEQVDPYRDNDEQRQSVERPLSAVFAPEHERPHDQEDDQTHESSGNGRQEPTDDDRYDAIHVGELRLGLVPATWDQASARFRT